ncbi:MAG: hypothetical protein EBU85_06555, partial [Actinobacteria bacterium]|nr:hypothetical protein [Actinomycetota bacterium]
AMSGKDLWKADRAGPLIARDLAIEGVQRFGMTECTVTLAICPGDRAFRVVSVMGANGVLAPAGVAAQLEALFDLRLASRGESELGELVERARWGHFVEVPKLRATTRSPEQAVAATP